MTMPAARFVRVHLGRASAVCLIMSLSGVLNARGDGVAYVSQQRSVEASVLDVNSGFFQDSLTSPGFSLFNVFLEVTPPSPTVVGRATQNSTLAPFGIVAEGSGFGEIFAGEVGQFGDGTSSFETTFVVATPIIYRISLAIDAPQLFFLTSDASIVFTGPDGPLAVVETPDEEFGEAAPIDYVGYLLAGEYTLTATTTGGVGGATPGGYGTSFNAELRFGCDAPFYAASLLVNETGAPDAVLLGPPDAQSAGLGTGIVEYVFETPIVNGPGPDIVVYESTSGSPEFDLVSVEIFDAGDYLSINASQGPAVPTVQADGYDPEFARGYDLGSIEFGPPSVTRIRLRGTGGGPPGGPNGFDLNAVAAVFLADAVCPDLTPAPTPIVLGPVVNPCNGHAYYLTDFGSWLADEQAGLNKGGHLVTINDAAEDQWLFDTFADFASIALFIGLNDRAVEDEFVWSSGLPVDYTNWSPGEPSNSGNEDVGGMLASNGRWNDFQESDQYQGILEIEPFVAPGVIAGPIVNPENGASYYLLDASNWDEAAFAAVELGGQLVTINDETEHDWVYDTFGFNGGLWIGLSDALVEGEFRWLSGQTPGYFNFGPGEPNGGTAENHVHIFGPSTCCGLAGTWNDHPNAGPPVMPFHYGVVEVPCNPADLDGDGAVDASDLATLLANWGQAGLGDFDCDGAVDAADLAQLLGGWGPC